MGEWMSSNILLPIMYFLVDMIIILGLILLVMAIIDKIKLKFK